MKTILSTLLTITLIVIVISCQRPVKDKIIPVTTDSEKGREYYDKAQKELDAYQRESAQTLLIKAIEEDSCFFMPYYDLSTLELFNGNIDGFKELASKALACEIKLSKGEQILKEALQKLYENPKTDVSELGARLVELYPNDVDAYLHHNFFLYIAGKNEDAVTNLNKALEIAEDPGPVYNNLGYVYLSLNKFEEAKNAFDKYIELEPDNPNPYDSKGDYFMAVKDYEKAYESYMKAGEIDSTWTLSHDKALKAKAILDSLNSLDVISL
jgi:tetratricopeptide (TPR) repeat protein